MSRILSPSFPFEPKRFPFFYGWIVLAISTLGVAASVPGQTVGVSVFTDSLMQALGLSRVQLSAAYMIGTIGSALILPQFGRWFDSVGARFMVMLSTATLAVTLMGLSQCDRVARALSFGYSGAVLTGAGFFVVTVGFLFVRFSGQGLLCMSARSMLGKWFNRRRGLVSGVQGVVVAFVFSAAPLGFNKIMNAYDWRGTWLILSVAVVLVFVIGWLFSRDNPEECGLLMDGDAENEEIPEAKAKKFAIVKEFTLPEARRTAAFWIFNLGMSTMSLIITAVTFHIVSIGEGVGLTREQSFAIFLPMSAVSVSGNFLFGWVSDHIPLKYCLAVMMALLALGVGGLPFFAHGVGRAAVIVGLGGGTGLFGPLITVIWPKYYGREHLGAISSLNLSSMVFASAIGPFIFGLSYERYGNYLAGIAVCLAMPLVLTIAAFWANNPQLALGDKR